MFAMLIIIQTIFTNIVKSPSHRVSVRNTLKSCELIGLHGGCEGSAPLSLQLGGLSPHKNYVPHI